MNGAFTGLMDAFIDTARRRSPIRESMPVHVRPTLFIRMMWVSTDIDCVVGPSDKYILGHRHPGASIGEETPGLLDHNLDT